MKLEVFYGHVLPEVLGCPAPTLDARIVAAAAEFCRETLSWSELQDPLTLIDGVFDYDIDPPAGAYTLSILGVWVDGRELRPSPGGMDTAELGNVPYYYNAAQDYGVLRVFPTPSNPTASMFVKACYVPIASATTLPDFLGTQYLDVIASGAKAELMLMPGQPWSNPQLSGYYKQRFQDGIIRSRILDSHGRVPGTLRVKPRQFGF